MDQSKAMASSEPALPGQSSQSEMVVPTNRLRTQINFDWSREECIYLISLYENNPILWNHWHNNFNSKAMKRDAWKSIADTMGCSVSEIKRKLESILASYRREKMKERRSPTYKSKWFAFDKLAFLSEKGNDNPYTSSDTGLTKQSPSPSLIADYSEADYDSGSVQHDDALYTILKQEPIDDIEPEIKRSKHDVSTEDFVDTTESMVIKRETSEGNNGNGKEIDVFVQYVANKLRKYSNRTRAIVEHEINNILFNADMGNYEGKA